jgi:hypothetical protein
VLEPGILLENVQIFPGNVLELFFIPGLANRCRSILTVQICFDQLFRRRKKLFSDEIVEHYNKPMTKKLQKLSQKPPKIYDFELILSCFSDSIIG